MHVVSVDSNGLIMKQFSPIRCIVDVQKALSQKKL